MSKNPIDREFIAKTDQLTIETDPLICSLCKIKITEAERFDKIVFLGSTHWYHESCGKQLVFDKLDTILTIDEKYDGVTKEMIKNDTE